MLFKQPFKKSFKINKPKTAKEKSSFDNKKELEEVKKEYKLSLKHKKEKPSR